MVDPKALMREHRDVLRMYAGLVLDKGAPLLPEEKEDQKVRMREFLAVGSSLRTTERELVHTILHGVLVPGSRCGCHQRQYNAKEG